MATSGDDGTYQPPTAPTGNLPKPILARQRAKQEAEMNGIEAPPKASYFPLGYKDAYSQWWASLTPAVTEHKVMSLIPYLQRPPTVASPTGSAPTSKAGSMLSSDKHAASSVDDGAIQRTVSVQDPYGPRQWQSEMVQLKGKDRYLNQFSVERVGEQVDNNLVMLHGYGAGLGFFYKNFEALSRLAGWKLYALDMLGMGRSSRPPFSVVKAKDREGKAREAESWFVDALEEWRVKKGIDKMTLMGHSLGGYMAVCYALKYPGHLHKLILASPVGIPEDPYAASEEAEPQSSTIQNEFTQTQGESASKTPQPAPPKRKMPWWLTSLWDANISPFSVVRLSGPLGPRLVSGWTSRRFSHLPEDEAQALHDYSYSLFRQRGSGEYALAHVLAPGAFARSPLIRRIQGVGRQFLTPHATPSPDNAASADASSSQTGADAAAARIRETGVPVVLMYGENDWMDVKGGYASVEKMNAEKKKALANASEREKQLENGDYKVIITRKAGHHVYLDGHEQFNNDMLDEMRDVEKRQKRLAKL
ncbi:putative alpha/beta hydrolase-1 [Septoria linicola]|nr:putative alpha/beta hydrolase-1 [Septoria linicola]